MDWPEFALFMVPMAILATVFGIAIMTRWFRHKEVLALIDKGLLSDAHYVSTPPGYELLIWGVMLTALGIALVIGLYPIGPHLVDEPWPLHFGPWMLTGLIPLFVGLGLLVLHFVIRKRDQTASIDEAG